MSPRLRLSRPRQPNFLRRATLRSWTSCRSWLLTMALRRQRREQLRLVLMQERLDLQLLVLKQAEQRVAQLRLQLSERTESRSFRQSQLLVQPTPGPLVQPTPEPLLLTPGRPTPQEPTPVPEWLQERLSQQSGSPMPLPTSPSSES